MGKRTKLTDGDVIWQSKFFPEMIFTSVMLEVFRSAYPRVKRFEPELKKAEAWLLANPERQPTSCFSKFINNWMKNADKYSEELVIYREPKKQIQRHNPTSPEPTLLADIMKKIGGMQ